MLKAIELTEAVSINVAISEYKGDNRLDIREYVKSSKYSGPTKKGVNLPVYKLDKLIESLQELRAEALDAGIPLKEEG